MRNLKYYYIFMVPTTGFKLKTHCQVNIVDKITTL